MIIDKDNICQDVHKPTYREFVANKPTEDEFYDTIDGFYWDVPYIAKALRRGELTFAKYMLLVAIRNESFERMLFWYVSNLHEWNVNLGAHGRNLEKLVSKDFLNRINSISNSGSAEDIWQSSLVMVDIFEDMASELAATLNYKQKVVNNKQVLEMCQSILDLSML